MHGFWIGLTHFLICLYLHLSRLKIRPQSSALLNTTFSHLALGRFGNLKLKLGPCWTLDLQNTLMRIGFFLKKFCLPSSGPTS